MRGTTTMEALRRPLTARLSAGVTVFLFTFVFYLSPLGRAVAQEIENTPDPIVLTGTPEQKMNKGLLKAQEAASKKHIKISQRLAEEGSILESALDLIGMSQLSLESVNDLQEITDLLSEQHAQIMAGFDKTEAELISKNLPEEILQRHQAAVAKYQASYEEMQEKFQAVLNAGSLQEQQKATGDLDVFMKDQKFKKRHQKTDPNKLPFATPKNQVRKPAANREELNQALGESKSSFTAEKIAKTLVNALVPSAYAAPIEQPTAEDLAETVDVQITDAIRQKATELNNDPIEIYNWVRNNIEYLPTHGSIQGSHMTLQILRGNAFDTSSLLIALLRASDIPARYAYGTVEIPVEKVMNWVGGVKTPEAAQQLLGQGGIPNTALIQGGKITHIRMEHVWVDAWVDFFPSRGVKNIQGDSWIPIDGSFKQYQFTEGSSLIDDVPFDIGGLNDQLLQEAEVDEQTGSITGLERNTILNFLNNYQQSAETYFSENGITPSIENILGAKEIVQESIPGLAAGLPYRLVSILFSDSALPSNLQHSAQIKLYATEYDRILDSPSMSHTIKLAELNSRRLGMTYEFMSEADRDLLQSYIDSGATTLPLYLFNVKPVLKLDEQSIAEGGSVGMGETQFIDVVLKDPSTSNIVSYEVTAGDEMVFGINGNGITQKVVEDRLNAVPSNTSAENLHQVALHYWMEYDFFDQMTAAKSDIAVQRLPSVGLFISPLTVSYFFGLPRTGQYQSRIMDVKRSISAVAGGTTEQRRQFVAQSGLQGSFLEGSVFDQLFDRSSGRGISAAQLIVDSTLFGIPLHFITSENIAHVLPQLSVGAAIKAEISSAINAGKTVLIPERELNRSGWKGTGYIIRDVQTGAGAYLISGGLNGGGIFDCLPDVVPLVVAILVTVVIALILIYLMPAIIAGIASVGAGIPAAAQALIASIAVLFAASPAYAGTGASDCFEQCEAQAEADESICRSLPDPSVRARCWSSVQERYGACVAGRPIPPLVTN